MRTETMDIHEAQKRFRELISLVTDGTEVVLTEKRVPRIRLLPVVEQTLFQTSVKNGEVLATHDEERNAWLQLVCANLDQAYGEDEPEYTTAMIKEFNPEYEGV